MINPNGKHVCMELVVGIVVGPPEVVHQALAIWQGKEPVLRLQCETAKPVLRNNIDRERLVSERFFDNDRSVQRQQLREVASSHLLRGHVAQIERMRRHALAVPQSVKESLVLDYGA